MNDEIKRKLKRIDEISEALLEESINEDEGLSEMLSITRELRDLGFIPPGMSEKKESD